MVEKEFYDINRGMEAPEGEEAIWMMAKLLKNAQNPLSDGFERIRRGCRLTAEWLYVDDIVRIPVPRGWNLDIRQDVRRDAEHFQKVYDECDAPQRIAGVGLTHAYRVRWGE
jgi:hypothetical protein